MEYPNLTLNDLPDETIEMIFKNLSTEEKRIFNICKSIYDKKKLEDDKRKRLYLWKD